MEQQESYFKNKEKFMTQIREKWNFLLQMELAVEWYEGAMVFRFSFLFFSLEPRLERILG